MSAKPADSPAPRLDEESVDDAQLIARLRDGELEAYEELWRRHIGPALRLAKRLTPYQPEDLAAEAFTTLLHQITVVGGGPDQNFRAYLNTVMRNLAIRWNRESRRGLPLSDADGPVVDDAPERLMEDEDARIVLQAFRTLPLRWQQVLWLAEVDDEPRPAIAARLKMSPNSVSALLRRARHGLRHRCLVEHVPEALRTDRKHVARVLPDLVAGKLTPDAVVKVTAHLVGCETCREVHRDLRSLAWRVKSTTLGALGFGALTFFIKELGVAGAAAASTTLAGTAVGGLLFSGQIATAIKIVAAAACVIAVVGPLTGTIPWPSDPPVEAADPPVQTVLPAPTVSVPRPEPVAPVTPSPSVPATTPSSQPTQTSPDVPMIELSHPATPAPPRPTPTPVDPDSTPVPSPRVNPPSSPTTPSAPAVAPGGTANGYLAPLLNGTAEPGATVAIQVIPGGPVGFSDYAIYTVTADAGGAWSFDLSSLELPPDTHQAYVWQVVESESSQATLVDFSIHGLTVNGLPPQTTIDNLAAEMDGILITVVAPGQSVACLRSSTGQTASIPLAADGTATRRIRFVGLGDFDLEVTICDGDRHGAPVRGRITVYELFIDPWSADLDPAIIVEEP